VFNLIFAFLLSLMFFTIYMRIRLEICHRECKRLLEEAYIKANDLLERGEYEKCFKPFERYEKEIDLDVIYWEVFKFHWELDLSDL